MAKFRCKITWSEDRTVVIEADSEEEALEKSYNGDWTVELVENAGVEQSGPLVNERGQIIG